MSSIEQQIIETPLNVPINPIVQLEPERESMMVVEPVAMPIPPVAPNTFMVLNQNLQSPIPMNVDGNDAHSADEVSSSIMLDNRSITTIEITHEVDAEYDSLDSKLLMN